MYATRRPPRLAAILFAATAIWAASAQAALEAHLYVDRITDIGNLDTGDEDSYYTEEGLFDSEPFWRVLIADEQPVSSTMPSAYTSWRDLECTDWTVLTTLQVGQSFERVVPDRAEAWFYVGVYDWDNWATVPGDIFNDPIWYAEILADHVWQGTADYTGGGIWAANNACCYFHRDPANPDDFLPVCGSDYPTGLGTTSNWRGYFRSWFEDTTGPSAATGLAHSDGDAPVGYNNDGEMIFSWTAGADANSGTGQLIRIERADGQSCQRWLADPAEGQFIFSGTVSCDAGGTLGSLSLQEGQSYRARIRTHNGVEPVISNVVWADSAFTAYVRQDSLPAATTITGPTPTSWRRTSFAVSVNDSSNAASCAWRVNGGAWTSRTCDGGFTVTVGLGGACSTAGSTTCQVETRAVSGGGSSDTDTRTFPVDWVAEPIGGGNLAAWRDATLAVAIAGGSWQGDATPYFTWPDPTSGAPAATYQRGFSATMPACDVLASSTSRSFDQSIALADGRHLFWVRVVDVAGNCSDAVAFDLRIDANGDPVGPITALPYAGAPAGEAIAAATWQIDSTPHFEWAPVEGAQAAVDGYALSWGAAAGDCSDLQTGTTHTVTSARPDGVHSFNVRAHDAAGNCGAASTFALYVDAEPEAIAGIDISDDRGAEIPSDAWQQNPFPNFAWSASSSAGTPLSYSRQLANPASGNADCVGDGSSTSYRPTEALSDGWRRFSVRALDLAGNCGPALSVELGVDRHAETIVVLAAESADGSAIAEGAATPEQRPVFSWETDRVVAAEAPVGFAVDLSGGVGAEPACEADTSEPSWQPSESLSEGDWVFSVRAVDEAGNCGPVATWSFTVDTTPPVLTAVVASPPVATTGDRVAIAVQTSEPLAEPPVATVGELPANAAEPTFEGDVWTLYYDVLGTESEGLVSIVISGVDAAGNENEAHGSLELDFTAPAVVLVYPAYREVLNIGDAVTITWETTESHPSTATIWLSREGTDAFTELLADGVADTGAFEWVVTGPETTSARLRIVVHDAVGLEGADEGLFDFRIRQAQADHLLLTADGGSAPVGQPVEVGLQIVDSLGDVVEIAMPVSITVDGSATILSTSLQDAVIDGQTVTGASDEGGRATLSVTSLVAEVVTVAGTAELPNVVANRDAVVRFEASFADHVAAFADDGVAPLGGVEAVTIQMVDREGNPVTGVFDVSAEVSGEAWIEDSDLGGLEEVGSQSIAGTTLADGSASLEVRSFAAETVTVAPDSSDDALTGLVAHEVTQVTFADDGAIDPFLSRVIAAPPVVLADDAAVAAITVEPRNSLGERVGGDLEVTVSASFGTLDDVLDRGDGTYESALSSAACPEEAATVSAEVEGIRLFEEPEVAFTCDAVVSAELSAEPARIPGDGVRCSILKVRPLSEDGALGGGHAIELVPSFGEVGVVDLAEDGETYFAPFCSTVCNELVSATIQVWVDGVRLSEISPDLFLEVEVDCIEVDTAASILNALPSQRVADGLEASTVTVTPFDNFGDRLGAGLTVAIATSHGDLTATTDLGDGSYEALLTATEPGIATVTATVNGVALEALANVEFFAPTRAFPGEIALTIEQEILGGALSPGGNATIRATVRSNLNYDLDDVYVTLTLDSGMSLKPESVRRDELSVMPESDSSGTRVALGRVSALGATPIEIRYEVQFDLLASGGLVAALQAFLRDEPRPVSELSRLSIPLDTALSIEPTVDACACNAQQGGGDALSLIVVLSIAAVWRRGRRRREDEHADPQRT